jgi:hypothetical protein
MQEMLQPSASTYVLARDQGVVLLTAERGQITAASGKRYSPLKYSARAVSPKIFARASALGTASMSQSIVA